MKFFGVFHIVSKIRQTQLLFNCIATASLSTHSWRESSNKQKPWNNLALKRNPVRMWDWWRYLLLLALALLFLVHHEPFLKQHHRHRRVLRESQQSIEKSELGDALQDKPTSYRGIISGEAASGCDFPWYAKFEGRILCGGTVVGNGNFVMTAAHCIDDYTPPSGTTIPKTEMNSSWTIEGISSDTNAFLTI